MLAIVPRTLAATLLHLMQPARWSSICGLPATTAQAPGADPTLYLREYPQLSASTS